MTGYPPPPDEPGSPDVPPVRGGGTPPRHRDPDPAAPWPARNPGDGCAPGSDAYPPGGDAYSPGGDAYPPSGGCAPDGTCAPGGGYASGSGHAPDGGHGQGGPYVPEGGYPHDGSGHGVPGGVPGGGPYVPEPVAAQLPPEAEHGAAFGVPSAGDAWGADHAGAPGGQDPYGNVPGASGGWTGAPGGQAPYGGGVPGAQAPYGNVPSGQDPYGGGMPGGQDPYGNVPGASGGWTGAPGGQAPYGGGMSGAQDPYGSVPSGQAPYGTGPGGGEGWAQAARWGGEGAQGTPAHGYDPYAGAPGGGLEHTAVLPAWTEERAGQAGPPAGGGALPPYGGELPAQTERPAAAPEAPAARTGSPIIAPGIQPAALTAALGLLTAGGAALGRPALAAVLLVLEGLTAAGWFRLNGMWPARQGIALAFLGGVTADVALLVADGGHATEVLLGTLGVWLLLVLVLQLRHHGSADERLSSLTATSVSALLTVVAASWLATAVSGPGGDPVVVGAVAVAAAVLARGATLRAPGGEPVSLVVALLAAVASGAATGPATGFGTGHALLLAAACGAAALIGLRVASYDFPSRFVHFTAGVALPLTAAAPVVYALGSALT